MATNDSKSYLGYLNKLVDQYNNTCQILKLLNLKLMIESGLLSTRILLAKVTPKICQEKDL